MTDHDSGPDNDGADFEQQDVLLREEGWARYELAKAAELAATMGGHPESAPALERVLLIAAHLDPLPERNDSQPDLFAA